MSMPPVGRAVISALERHTAAGRLSLDEFGERVTRVLHAATHGELRAVVADLPVDPTAAAEESRSNARQLVIAFALAALTLILLGVAFAIGR
jgi:hypothetical protein